MGIEFSFLGLSSYVAIWGSIFLYLKKMARFFKRNNDKVMSNLGNVLRYFMLVLGVMGFGSGLNAAFIIFTYFSLIGMYLSAYQQEKKRFAFL